MYVQYYKEFTRTIIILILFKMKNLHILQLLINEEELKNSLESLRFSAPVITAYNPLRYAWIPYKVYLERFSTPPKKTLFLGMNPGPWGMAQTGVPFGEISAVRDWLGVTGTVEKPENEIPGRPITGFNCTRSEVSGRRVWGLLKKRFETPEAFFLDHFVVNYCPLIFFDKDGKNITPDKINKADRESLFAMCDRHLATMIEIFKPRFLAGFGAFAAERFEAVRTALPATSGDTVKVIRLPHPSPANPQANRGWEEQVERILMESGAWK